MAKKEVRKVRGVFERPKGSGIWWINFYVSGKQRREKVGRKSDAIALYQQRKADAHRGLKLPEPRRSDKVIFADLINMAKEYAKDHKSAKDYTIKAGILTVPFGSRPAAEITPQEIEGWLNTHCKTPATANRYKAFFSLCFREGQRNGKVDGNPARLVRHRKEPTGRYRFLSRDKGNNEYQRLHDIIAERYPENLPAFIVSVYSGMRLSEQFSCTWSQVNLHRRTIELSTTKNGSARTVRLNSVAANTLVELKAARNPRPSDRVFPCEVKNFDQGPWFNAAVAEAKIDNFTWHNNRHTFCSWLAMAGVSLKEIQELAGHKTIQMSARYSHLSSPHVATAAERLVQTGA